MQIHVQDLALSLAPPQSYLAYTKGSSDGDMPILSPLAQELRTHLTGRRSDYRFESNRADTYTPRYIQLIVRHAARQAGIEKEVAPAATLRCRTVARRSLRAIAADP